MGKESPFLIDNEAHWFNQWRRLKNKRLGYIMYCEVRKLPFLKGNKLLPCVIAWLADLFLRQFSSGWKKVSVVYSSGIACTILVPLLSCIPIMDQELQTYHGDSCLLGWLGRSINARCHCGDGNNSDGKVSLKRQKSPETNMDTQDVCTFIDFTC